jgi:hypothetical protein
MADFSSVPGAYVARDGNWYGPDGTLLGPSDQAPNPAIATGSGPGATPGRAANIGQPADPVPSDQTTTPPPSSAGFQWPSYTLPTPYQFTPFSYDSYTPLTADQAAQTPGYAFGAQQGRDAIQTSAAANGNVLSGATLKDLFSWGDQFAGQNYQQAETQNENVYNMNRNNAFNNWAGNQAGGLQAWEANNQPAQFQAASINQPQAALTFADLFNRLQLGVNANTAIATAGAS